MWEDAYYSNRSNLSETKYSTIGIKGAKNLEINSNERRYNRLYAYLKTAKDIADQNKGKSLETRNIETKKQTQWYQTKYGDWATIISDKDSKLTKKLYPNKTYKLGEILKHDLLYKAYPGLEKLRVKTVDSINATGAFESIKGLPTNTLTTDILLKNSDINKKDFRKTILHEVNHFIEGYEKFNKNSRGANHGNMTIDEYRNNLGEIISNETKILADLTQDELDNIILFEQGKTNPQDKNIRKVIDLSNKMDKRSGQNNNINSAGYSGQNKVQLVSQNNIKNNKDNILKKLFHDKELENSSFSYDNQGRKLTKEQQEYFKDSKVRDENGNLKVLYHGSPNQFTEFSYDYIGSNGTALGKGFYLTDSISMAEGFTGNGNKVMELYASITKPMSLEELTISKSEFKKFVSEIAKQDEYWIYDYGDADREGFNKVLNYAVDLNYDNETNDIDLIHGILNTSTLGWEDGFRVLNKTLGYDGVIKHYEAPIDQATGESNVYVPFFPEQIKNITNENPTTNSDIRYSQNNKSWQQYLKENFPSAGTKTKMSDIKLLVREFVLNYF